MGLQKFDHISSSGLVIMVYNMVMVVNVVRAQSAIGRVFSSAHKST